ncbi:MAG: hypothetical protein ACR2G2_10380 [Pseudonocardia sp.]
MRESLIDSDDFAALGADFEHDRGDLVHRGTVGAATTRLFPLGDAVDQGTLRRAARALCRQQPGRGRRHAALGGRRHPVRRTHLADGTDGVDQRTRHAPARGTARRERRHRCPWRPPSVGSI